jgi:hypothetical protein
MSRSTDPCTAVNIDADVTLGRHGRLPGVDTHADVYWTASQRPLRRLRCGDRIGGSLECDEESVALRVNLDAAALGDRGSQRTTMDGEDLHIPVA